jgi:hypothetical protein
VKWVKPHRAIPAEAATGVNQRPMCEQQERGSGVALATIYQKPLIFSSLRGVGREDLYFSCVEIDVNVVSSFVPKVLTVAIITTEIPAAISPYSMAVAPLSSLRNRLTVCSITDNSALFSKAVRGNT